jgi:hypothetical protein
MPVASRKRAAAASAAASWLRLYWKKFSCPARAPPAMTAADIAAPGGDPCRGPQYHRQDLLGPSFCA